MEFIFIIIGIVIFLNAITKKAKQEEARRAAAARAEAQRRAQAGMADPAGQRMTPENRVPVFDPRFPPRQSFGGAASGSPQSTAQAPGTAFNGEGYDYAGSMPGTSEERNIKLRDPAATARASYYGEGAGSGTEANYSGSMQGTAEERNIKLRDPEVTARVSYKGDLHVVRSAAEGGHTHEETSMTGNTDKCPPTAEAAAKAPVAVKVGGIRLEFGTSAVQQGILYSEILAKPKALRR